MTGTREPQQDGSIQAMLRDSGLEAAADLRTSLEALRSLVPDRAPAPRGDLAVLLAAGSPAGSGAPTAGTSADATMAMPTLASVPGPGPGEDASPGPAEEALPAGVSSLAERRGRKRRLAIVGGAVVGAMTLGAGAVAASGEDFRAGVSHAVGIVFQPSGATPDSAPQPVRPSPADIPTAPVPSAPVTTTPPTADDVAAVPGSAAAVPAGPGAAATPPALGRDGVLPTPPHRPVAPGVPALPGRSGDRSLPTVPLPVPTLPGALPELPGHP